MKNFRKYWVIKEMWDRFNGDAMENGRFLENIDNNRDSVWTYDISTAEKFYEEDYLNIALNALYEYEYNNPNGMDNSHIIYQIMQLTEVAIKEER